MKRLDKKGFPPLIILAGGKSERFGSPKGLAQVGVDGRSLLYAHIKTFLTYGATVIVVVGYITDPYINEVAAIAAEFSDESGLAIRIVTNQKPEDGPFSSLQVGISGAGDCGSDGVFVLPVDTGIVPAALYLALDDASDCRKVSVIPEFDSKGGHPVFLSAELIGRFAGVDSCSDDGRLDVQLRKQSEKDVIRLPVVWPAVLENWNRPNRV